jgi:ATP-dependent Clp protease adaptor protein ClpS
MVLEKTHKITLYNDDHHDFLYIIACLIKVCKHSPDQAEQCAIIVDNIGSYDIKSGGFDDIFNIYNQLSDLELNVEIGESQMH